jgi:hypothetical protein
MFGREVKPDALRRQMPEHDIFLWEGHHNTLVVDWAFTKWDEPLRPSFLFLQSCLALMEEKIYPLFDRGAVGVVGSSTRIYSATGGAYTLAFFDALLYERQSVGGALRHAKNYLHSVALLKEKRLGPGASAPERMNARRGLHALGRSNLEARRATCPPRRFLPCDTKCAAAPWYWMYRTHATTAS